MIPAIELSSWPSGVGSYGNGNMLALDQIIRCAVFILGGSFLTLFLLKKVKPPQHDWLVDDSESKP